MQGALWGDKSDDTHTPNDWVAIASRQLGLAANDGAVDDEERFRRQMIRLAALCVAAVESRDRITGSTKDHHIHKEGSGY